MAALASVLYVGKRRVLDQGPHSIPFGGLGHRPPVVRMVRVQRGSEFAWIPLPRSLPQYGHRGLFRAVAWLLR